MSDRALDKLMDYNWPGNVRELRNVIERAVILAGDGVVTRDQLSFEMLDEDPGDRIQTEDLREATAVFERNHIRSVLDRVDGDRQEAARRLGIDPSTLYRKLQD